MKGENTSLMRTREEKTGVIYPIPVGRTTLSGTDWVGHGSRGEEEGKRFRESLGSSLARRPSNLDQPYRRDPRTGNHQGPPLPMVWVEASQLSGGWESGTHIWIVERTQQSGAYKGTGGSGGWRMEGGGTIRRPRRIQYHWNDWVMKPNEA